MYEVRHPKTHVVLFTTDNPFTVITAMAIGWEVKKAKESESPTTDSRSQENTRLSV